MPADNDDEFDKGAEPDKEEDIYEEDSRDELEENAEITPQEEGFMEGYDEEEKAATCALCHRVIVEKEGVVERDIAGLHLRFCSEHCADAFRAEAIKKK